MAMPSPNPTRPYSIPGFRIALVREPGVKLAERPALRTAAECAPILAQYIGDADREVFVVAMLTIRHRLIGVSKMSVGCLTSSLVHPRDVNGRRGGRGYPGLYARPRRGIGLRRVGRGWPRMRRLPPGP